MMRRLGSLMAVALVALAATASGALAVTATASASSASARPHASAATTTTDTVSAGAITAKFSYSGSGITSRDLRLQIIRKGRSVYDQVVPRTDCFHTCVAGEKQSVHVADLYGDGSEDVVLTLFSGGADCCSVDDVYVPSAAVDSYVVDSHNFGEAGAVLRNIGPGSRPVFVSADSVFYCRFTDCAASALPLQILEFEGERFVDVTRSYPKLIAADAERWLKLYSREPSDREGLIAAYVADQYQLGGSGRTTADTVLDRREHDGSLTRKFVAQLLAFIKAHDYG